DGAMTVAPAPPLDRITLGKDGTLSGRALGVPFASDAQHIAVVAEDATYPAVTLVATKDCRIDEGQTLAGDASNVVIFDRVKPLRHSRAPAGFDLAAPLMTQHFLKQLRQRFAAPKPQPKAQASRTKSSVQSVLPRNTCCIASLYACWRGART